MENTSASSDSLLQALADGRMSLLDQLYDRYRDDFLRWAGSRFQIKNRDDILDAWHDTMIMFYEQVRDRKLTHLTCDIKTYLFTIGYRRLIKLHKKSERIDLVDEVDVNINMEESINVLESEAMSERKQQLLMSTLQELPEKSRQILTHRFLNGKSIADIQREMGYASENAVSVTLSRSLKQLKELISQRMASQAWEQ